MHFAGARGHQFLWLDALSGLQRLALIVIFLSSFAITYFAAYYGGPVMTQSQVFTENYSHKSGSNWTVELTDMDRINQQFTLEAELSNKVFQKEGIQKEVTVDVTLFGKMSAQDQYQELSSDRRRKFSINCPVKRTLCDKITLLRVPSIEWNQYRADISMKGLSVEEEGRIVYTYTYINPRFSLMAMCLKYFFLIVAFQIGWQFHKTVVQHGGGDWNTDRKLVLMLLLGLVLYDDPLYVARLTMGGFFFPVVSRLCQATYFCIVALFVLVSTDRLLTQLKSLSAPSLLGAPQRQVRLLPHTLVVGSLWLGIAALVVLVRIHENQDPMYRVSADFAGFALYKFVTLVLVVTIAFWYVYLVLRTFGEISDISEAVGVQPQQQSQEFRSLRRRFFFHASMSSVLFSVIVGSFLLWYLGVAPLPGNNTQEYAAFTVFFNVYTLIVVSVSCPYPYSRLDEDDDRL